jgi:putative FmdB family regulatory protein
MPTYNYKCKSCGHQFEDFRKISNRIWDKDCPNCGKEKDQIELTLFEAPKIVSAVRSVYSRTDQTFRDKLNSIKKHYPRNTIKV